MRCVFIVNPAAGKKDAFLTVYPAVRDYCLSHSVPFACHVTKRKGHASELAAREGGKGDPVRIYGFGGDGTLSEIAAGTVGIENAEIGIFPCGSGNDYIRTFGKTEDFLNPEKQITASSRTVDLIRSGKMVAVNLCTVGMDAKVPLEVEKLKRWPFLSGPAAYNFALAKVLLGRIGDEMKITIDGDRKHMKVVS